MATQTLTSKRLRIEDSLEAINQLFHEKGWTDGLPIIPPTEDRVRRMLTGTKRKPEESLGGMPPKFGEATIEKVAVNAVMAGCLPEYMPILITAVEGMLDERYPLYGMQATTHPAAPLAIVNGPIVKKVGLNAGYGLFGPGWQANATIGRAIRLMLLNMGGATPGKVDRSTMGQPCKYTYCVAENEDASPWEPLHVEHGFAKNTSTVTMSSGENPHNINDHVGTNAEHILAIAAGTVATMGVNFPLVPLMVICPEHAATIAKDGFSKNDVKHFLFEHARLPLGKARASGMYGQGMWPKWWDSSDPETSIPVTENWEDIIIVVAGGAGKHSAFIATFGHFFGALTKEIR
ncbi:MAG: hypothetical protein HYX92_07605 [Chloroflexi bacterium]|nr:hypothetical protein [Chloroflexota bacterium]